MLDPRPGTRCTAGMATLDHPAYEVRDAASHPTDTPVFHVVEQKLHAGWLFDPRSPAPGPASAALPRAAATPRSATRRGRIVRPPGRAQVLAGAVRLTACGERPAPGSEYLRGRRLAASGSHHPGSPGGAL